MASSSSPSGAQRARDARRRAGTPQWDGHAAFDRAPRSAASIRRRRLVKRALPVLVVLIAAPLLISWWGGRGPLSPEKVAAKAHDEVLREVIARTGDYSTTLGPLSCTAFVPGKGNCLAQMRSSAHQTDHLMVAAAYDLTQGDDNLHLVIKLP